MNNKPIHYFKGLVHFIINESKETYSDLDMWNEIISAITPTNHMNEIICHKGKNSYK